MNVKTSKSFPLKQSILRHDRMGESHRILCSDYQFEKACTSLPKPAFTQKWNSLMLIRYANLKREKQWEQEARIKRLLLIYSLGVPMGIKLIICEFLKPGPPSLPVLRRYTNSICEFCGDALAWAKLPCFTCGCVK